MAGSCAGIRESPNKTLAVAPGAYLLLVIKFLDAGSWACRGRRLAEYVYAYVHTYPVACPASLCVGLYVSLYVFRQCFDSPTSDYMSIRTSSLNVSQDDTRVILVRAECPYVQF